MNDEERLQLYSIPDIDIPPSPPPQQNDLSPITQSSVTTDNNILDILTFSSSLPESNRTSRTQTKKPVTKRKKKKKPMSEYRPPSPFSPKPDYKSMTNEQLKTNAMKYGLSTTLSKGRLILILDEIYNVTHQYETDTDYEFDLDDMNPSKDLSHTPPTPAIIPEAKKVRKRPAVHQMSSSDDNDKSLSPPPAKKPTPITTMEQEPNEQSDDHNDTDHEGRFLELTVHELSTSTTSSSSLSVINSPTSLPLNDIHLSETKSK